MKLLIDKQARADIESLKREIIHQAQRNRLAQDVGFRRLEDQIDKIKADMGNQEAQLSGVQDEVYALKLPWIEKVELCDVLNESDSPSVHDKHAEGA